ncbi:MAG: ATP-binding protein [Nitrospirota bacterium]|nr:ATP-binding protein [Nitrospirota bacterium]
MKEVLSVLDPPLAIAAIFINFIFVVLVIVRTSRSLLYMVFLSICLVVMYWNFCTFLAYVTGDQSWFYLSLAGSAMIPVLMFHFVFALVKPGRRSTAWIAPAYFFSCLLASAGFLALAYQRVRYFADSAFWDILYLVLLFPLFLTGLVMLLGAFRRTRSGSEKSRLLYILLAGVIGVFTAFTDHARVLKVPVPPLGHLGSVFYSSVLAIGVFRHRTAYDILAQVRMKLEVMNEMAAGISHEIRNPLTSIKGALRLLGNRIGDLERQGVQPYLDIIYEEISRLDSILVNFQYLTKPLKVELEPTAINTVIEKTVGLAEMGGLNTVSIRTELSSQVPLVKADALSLKQVFLNLIKNAADACNPDGELLIRTEYVPPWVVISFDDSGPGVTPEIIGRVFNPFITTKTGGLGMGLAISRRIIDAHEGKIEVTNLTPHGARFTIHLPAENA